MKFTSKILATALTFAVLVCASAHANQWGSQPLRPCSVRGSVKGGISPTIFTDRGNTLFIAENAPGGIVASRRLPSFSDEFNLPWTIGGILGYAMDCNTELFVEGEYTRAEGKSRRVLLAQNTIIFDIDAYQNYAFFLGGRYYFDYATCGCQGLSPFVGMKFGVMRQPRLKADVRLDGVMVTRGATFHEANTVPAGSFQVGLNYSFSDCFFVYGLVEALYSGHLRGRHARLPAGGGVETISVGETGALLSFPVTIGIGYSM